MPRSARCQRLVCSLGNQRRPLAVRFRTVRGDQDAEADLVRQFDLKLHQVAHSLQQEVFHFLLLAAHSRRGTPTSAFVDQWRYNQKSRVIKRTT